ncbi:MAG: hypothetical protein ACK5CA_01190 [Cyanobacteriota bacterium]|jgi:glutaredoxin
MPKILLWTPESDYDSQVVKLLADKINELYKQKNSFTAVGRQVYAQAAQQQKLDTMINTYLKKHDLIIFLLDSDGVQSQHQRRQQPNSLINQINRIVNNQNVFLIEIKQELEAWLLIDCLGICCYYNPRIDLREDKDWVKFAQKHQRGDTTLILEAESGGRCAKEYLENFSDQINLKLNSVLADKPKNLKSKRYQEKNAPEIAPYIWINHETLKRNSSLKEFALRISAQD